MSFVHLATYHVELSVFSKVPPWHGVTSLDFDIHADGDFYRAIATNRMSGVFFDTALLSRNADPDSLVKYSTADMSQFIAQCLDRLHSGLKAVS